MIGGSLFLPANAAYILAAATCAPATTPVVTIDFMNTPPVYRHDLSAAALGEYDISTTFSRGAHEKFEVGGLTVGEIRNTYQITYQMESFPAAALGCVRIDRVDIKVIYTPEVLIADKYRKGSCDYKETVKHELRHVNTDVITLNEYIPRIRQAVETATARLGAQGPYDRDGMKQATDMLTAIVKEQIERYRDVIDKTRLARHQLIDTRQEYLRMSSLCR